ncbi:hypothetical protein K461DRAFT_299980 [Myriangium duriaei CBS 260.36]|uniref:Uncharacterized protein n=1 Tax=Myriangium duriaei CBS 260.36 TaxID=1168546 RepID=A0A9P4JG19_9PEZI|nr:hypothetical protein K461DRAFT_299980 [Myriangium duriaei CBS 260.36]
MVCGEILGNRNLFEKQSLQMQRRLAKRSQFLQTFYSTIFLPDAHIAYDITLICSLSGLCPAFIARAQTRSSHEPEPVHPGEARGMSVGAIPSPGSDTASSTSPPPPSLLTSLSTTQTTMLRARPLFRPAQSAVRAFTQARHLHNTPPAPATPIYMLSALSHARETQHYALRSGLGVTHHSPAIEAIKASEVDPFDPAPDADLPRAPASNSSIARAPHPPQHTSPTAPVAGGAAPLHPIGARELAARQRVASLILGGDASVLRPMTHVLPGERKELARALLGRSPAADNALAAGVKARLAVAREADENPAALPVLQHDAGPSRAYGTERVGKSRPSLVEGSALVQEAVLEAEEVKEKEKPYQTFTSEGMQVALLVAVVALVAVNAFAFETLGAERAARELNSARLTRLETALTEASERAAHAHHVPHVIHAASPATSPAPAAAMASAAGTEVGAAREVAGTQLLPNEVVPKATLGDRMTGWVKSAFWVQ